MKIKDIWDKFLELRKSPTCIFMAFIGLLDAIFIAIFFLMHASIYISELKIYPEITENITFYAYILFYLYVAIRYEFRLYYTAIIVIIYLVEFIFKVRAKSGIIKNNKLYATLWCIGIIMFVVFSIIVKTMSNSTYSLWSFF